jgi:hypothetical protein
MNNQKPLLAAQLAAILGLPPGAAESEIVETATAWAGERKRQQDSAAFEGRIAALVKLTNMPREEAIQCLRAQDATKST